MRELNTVFVVPLLLFLLTVVFVPVGWCETPEQQKRDINELFRNPGLDQGWFTNRVNEWIVEGKRWIGDGTVKLTEGGKLIQTVPGELDTGFRLSCRVKVEGKGYLLCLVSFSIEGGAGRHQQLRWFAKGDWQEIQQEFSVPDPPLNGKTVNSMQFLFLVKGADTTAYLSNMSLKAVSEAEAEGTKRVVLNGAPCTGVFLSSQASDYDVTAARELRKYIYKISAVVLPKQSLSGVNKGAKQPGRILMGQAAIDAGMVKKTEREALGWGGYIVRCADGCLAIVGKGDGAESAVFALLEKSGAKFVARNVSVLPVKDVLAIPALEFSRSPVFEWRGGSKIGDVSVGYSDRRVMGSFRDMGFAASWVHTSYILVNPWQLLNEHPEYFALIHGKRPEKASPREQLCMSNPDVRRVATENMLRWIAMQPDRKYFAMTQNDGARWCECEKCRALDTVPGKVITDRLLDFVNHVAREVAKKYPDKIIITLAYTGATGPVPMHVKPEPNVRVMYAPYPHDWDCQSHAFCEKNSKGMKDLADWLKLCSAQIYIFDYPRSYQRPLVIFGSFYAMVYKIRYYADSGIKVIYFCDTPDNFRDLFNYVMGRLMWDTKIDVEKTIDEFMELYYGPAAPFMREYFNMIYREIKERPVHQQCESTSIPSVVTGKFAEKGYKLFEQAEKAVGDDKILLSRVQDQKLFLYAGDLSRRRRLRKEILKKPQDLCLLADFIRLARVRKQQGTNSKMFRWLVGLNFSDPWYKDPKVDEFLNRPVVMQNEEGKQK